MILCTNELLSDLWNYVLDTYDPVTNLDNFQAMPRPVQVFYLVFWWDCELQNGGVGQFILNHSGNQYLETVDALLSIGSVRSAMWMTYVQDALGITFSPCHEKRHIQLNGMDISEFDVLDEAASQRVRELLGEWKTEEDELNLIAYVEAYSLADALSPDDVDSLEVS